MPDRSAGGRPCKKIYARPKNPRTGEQIFPGQPPGTEGVPGSWSAWITPRRPRRRFNSGFGNSYYGAAVFEDPKWDFHTFDFDRDVRIGDAKAGPILNATSPDLRSFRAEAAKLIQYHGWGDAAIPAVSSIDYYDSVRTFSPGIRIARARPAARLTIFIACSWFPAWATAVAARARTVSMHSPPWKTGLKKASLQHS